MSGAIAARLQQAAWLMAEVGHRRDQWALCRHPFHERWAAGELTGDELRIYAAEHHHVALTRADVARRAAAGTDGLLQEQLARLGGRADAGIAESCAFARAVGWGSGAAWHFAADPLPATEAAVRRWTGTRERAPIIHLITLYVLETAHGDPERHPARPDRRRREPADIDGAGGLLAAAIAGLLPVADPFALVRHAELCYRSYWELLDGVELCGLAATPGRG